MQHGPGERNGIRVALGGELRDDRAAGVAQAQRLCHLVEGLAHRVVDGGAEHAVVAPIGHVHEHGIAARNERHHGRRREIGPADLVGVQVSLQMVHDDEGDVGAPGRALGEGHAHHERAHEPRRVGDRHGVQVAPAEARSPQARRSDVERLVAHAADGLDMLAAGDLGHDAAEARVEIHLGRHHVRAQNSPAVDDGGGRLVAGRLDGQNERMICRDHVALPVGGDLGRPRARSTARLRVSHHAVRNRRQRDSGQGPPHDEGVLPVGIVARPAPQRLVAEGRVQRLGPRVCGAYFQRTRARPQVAGVVGHAGEQDASDAVAAPCGIHSHLQNLQVAVDHPAAGIAHQRRLGGKRHLGISGIGGPPYPVGAAQLVGHERLVPRIGSHHGRLQGRHIGHMTRIERLVGDALAVGPGVGDGRVVHGHVLRAPLARQGTVGPGQALPLVLLGVRQARVHGQGEGRIVALGVEGIALPRAP